MKCALLFGLATFAVITLAGAAAGLAQAPPPEPLRYDAEGRMIPPDDYRDWVFLSSGMDMSYSEAANAQPDHHMFDNVFAPRAAYEAFKRDGKWPDKTVLILEVRGGQSKGSINKRGTFQSTERMGLEAHVKDEARFKGGWGFFDLGAGKPAKPLPYAFQCYACHQDHAAADTTFVQFYPTLLPIAANRKTLSAAYLAESKDEKR